MINPGENATPAQAAGTTQLPPEILVDRRLGRVERLLAEDDHGAAHDVMNEIVALQREHDVALPAEFPFQTREHAQRIAGHASPTDPVVTAGATAIRAAHLMELRAAVAVLE